MLFVTFQKREKIMIVDMCVRGLFVFPSQGLLYESLAVTRLTVYRWLQIICRAAIAHIIAEE